MTRPGWLLLPLLPLLLGAARHADAVPASRADDIRLGRVLYRLDVAAAPLCKKASGQTGLILHELADYNADDRGGLIATFGLDRGPGILAVAEGSPAAAAGVGTGDVIAEVDGAPASRATIEKAPPRRMLTLTILRNHVERVAQLTPIAGCPARAELVDSNLLNAFADGDSIQVPSRMMAFTRTDAALAALLAHEIGHVALEHPPHAGRAAELAADRLSIEIMARAGYPLAEARAFWRRYLSRLAKVSPTDEHPPARMRLAAIDAAIAEISPDGAVKP